MTTSGRKSCVCEFCGATFETYRSRPGRFCSSLCRSKFGARQKRPNRQPVDNVMYCCDWCGKSFVIHRCQLGRTPYHHCCRECANNHNSEQKRGEGNPNYTGGTKFPNRGSNWYMQRRAALRRDGHVCAICGKKRGKMDVHHIRPYKEFNGDYLAANDLSNLIVLCRRCHAGVDKRGKPCPVKLL